MPAPILHLGATITCMHAGLGARARGRRAGVVAERASGVRADGHGPAAVGRATEGDRDMSNIDYPYHFDGRGRTALTEGPNYIRDLIEQVLLTAQGERVMRPGFGSGVMQRVSAAASPEVAATSQFLKQGALQQWLSDVITFEAVEVEARDGSL